MLENLFKNGKTLINFFVSNYKWWLNPDCFCAIESSSYKDSSLEKLRSNLVAYFFRGKMLTDKKSFSSNRLINIWIFFYKSLETIHHIVSFFSSLLREIITKHHFYPSNPSTTGERTATGCCRVNKWIRIHHTLPDFFGGNKGRDWHHSSAQRLSKSHNIRYNSPMIDCKDFSSTTKTSLYFIGYKKSSIFFRKFTHFWPIIIWWDNCSRFSLNRLNNYSSDTNSKSLTGFKLCLHGLCITILHKVYWSPIHLSYRLTIECFPHH